MTSASSHNIDDYESLLVALQSVLGVVVPEGQHNNLVERIEPLLAGNNFDTLAQLADKLQENNSDLRADVLDAISRRQPGWQLSPEIKNVLKNYIFSQLADKARIWVVGCAQGQLAYSVAMELAEFEQAGSDVKNVQLVATDVSQADIKQAEPGIYSTQELLTVPDKYKKSYFTINGPEKSAQVKAKIRQQVSFSQCDLNEDFQSIGEMDLIICPEVLAYFTNGTKAGILKQFSRVLKPGGIFLSGGQQAVPSGQGLERVEHSAGIFYRKKS